MIKIEWLDDIFERYKNMGSSPAQQGPSQVPIMDLVNAEVVDRNLSGRAPPIPVGNDPHGWYQGYPVSELLKAIPSHRRTEAIFEVRKMAMGLGAPTVVGVGAGGLGIGGVSSPPLFDHENALAMRMRWRNIHNTPFENVHVHAVHGKEVFVTVITKDLKAVTLDVDDDALFPSDHLITELRVLGG